MQNYLNPGNSGPGPYSNLTGKGKSKMEKSYITKKEKETLSEFKLGQIDILRWLETTFQKEKSQLETLRAEEIFELHDEDFLVMKKRLELANTYLFNIKKTIKQIKGE